MISKDILRIFAMADFPTLLFCITSSLGQNEKRLTQQQFEQYHNMYRKMLVEGSVPDQSKAKYMPNLISDGRLVKDARNWATRCVFKHDDSSKDGENLAASSSLSVNPVTLWFEEHKLYKFGKVTDKNVQETGHYTQRKLSGSRTVSKGVTILSTVALAI
ncbi:hypothetical protein X801_03532 [Opisthorchis viverrini]|uniref:SCP domain-containing protein n=1 Tax=Opisthorchis viverrini TaxID=6198 RepID=A0A1S8X1I6_OPIVI|nr:hypothetical protein X801_03532 [Opisthorchis viverrini]